ncbi:hypothetical protein DBA29_07940 [Xenophilus aerolatus]|nr:hypothetical protein [Xenophilus aerolatus]
MAAEGQREQQLELELPRDLHPLEAELERIRLARQGRSKLHSFRLITWPMGTWAETHLGRSSMFFRFRTGYSA